MSNVSFQLVRKEFRNISQYLTSTVSTVDAVSLSMQRRREVQEKYHFQQPPALRMDSKMESTSAKILKLIRPSRYIETVRFKRKAWARKRVVSNPFQFGEDSFNDDDRSESSSVFSPDSSYAEDDDGELYENGNVMNKQDERHRSQSLPVDSYTGHSVFELTLSERRGDVYENMETSQVQNGDVSDHLEEKDCSKKVNEDIHSSSENGVQVFYENIQRQKDAQGEIFFDFKQEFYENTREHTQTVKNEWEDVFASGNGQETNAYPSVSVLDWSFPNPSRIKDLSPTLAKQNLKGMSDVNIPEKLTIFRENHIKVTTENSGSPTNNTEDMYVNTRKIEVREHCEGSILHNGSMVDQGHRRMSKVTPNNDTEQMKEGEDEMTHPSELHFPSPDYLDNGSPYNFHEMPDHDENEDVYDEVMGKAHVNHHEMAHDSEQEYVNVSPSWLQTCDVRITSSVHGESAQRHRMSFPRV